MGTTVSAVLQSTTGRQIVNIMNQIAFVFCLAAAALGSPVAGPDALLGYGSPCTEEVETILVKACHLEPSKSCTSETKVVGKKVTGHEDPVCEEVEGCSPSHAIPHGPGFGHPFGKRAAEAQYSVGCVKITHQVCQPGAPITEDVTEEIETCSVTSMEVCEDVEKTVPKVTCKNHKGIEH